MTPVSTNPTRLTLRARPWLLAAGISAGTALFAVIAMTKLNAGEPEAAKGPLILTGLFALVFVVFVRQDTVIFDRPAGEISISRRTVFGATATRHPMKNLRRAVVERHQDDAAGSRKATYRPVLEFYSGPRVPLTPIYSSGSGAEQSVKAINAWLRVKT